MSGSGRPAMEAINAKGLRLGIVAARWNAEITNRLLGRAIDASVACGIPSPVVARVAGSIELAVVAQELAHQCDAVVALGVVIKGGTPHFEYVCDSVTQGLTRVALDLETPVGNGVLTCLTQEQAVDRSGAPGSAEDKGWETAISALDVALTLRSLRAAETTIEIDY